MLFFLLLIHAPGRVCRRCMSFNARREISVYTRKRVPTHSHENNGEGGSCRGQVFGQPGVTGCQRPCAGQAAGRLSSQQAYKANAVRQRAKHRHTAADSHDDPRGQ